MKYSIKNRTLGKIAAQPKKLRTMPNYPAYDMKNPTKVVKQMNKGLDNTKPKSKTSL